MSLIYTCNLCGEMIDRETPYVTLNGNGDRAKDFWRTGYVGHYHADPEVGCWDRILESIRLCDAPELDKIPTATYQSSIVQLHTSVVPQTAHNPTVGKNRFLYWHSINAFLTMPPQVA